MGDIAAKEIVPINLEEELKESYEEEHKSHDSNFEVKEDFPTELTKYLPGSSR